MPTFLHISDLHFGPRFVTHLGQVLLNEIKTLNPDAVIISGDFTLRARHNEYQAAQAFLKEITFPTLTIPGNHDQPVFAPLERLTTPYARYCKYICSTVDASLATNGLFILGLSDCRPILPGGFWSQRQRRWIQEQLQGAPRDSARIVVSHHQFLWGGKWRPAGFWYPTRALNWLGRLGVEMVLNGHTHIPTAAQLENGIVVARAGTATSERIRHGWGNTYNIASIDEKQVSVFVRQFDEKADAFVAAQAYTFPRHRKLTIGHQARRPDLS